MTETITVSFSMLLLAMAAAGFAGFIDSICGGGGLITLPAYLVAGIPPHNAYGVNKFAAVTGTTFATINYFKGGAMDVKMAIIAAGGSFVGSAIAAQIVMILSDAALKMLVLIAVPLVAVIIFSQRHKEDVNQVEEGITFKKVSLALVIGVIVGGYDGLIGPGTGTFAIIAFSSIMKYDVLTAGGNAKVLNLASNAAALVTFLIHGLVLFKVAIPCAVATFVGTQIGSKMALKGGANFIRPMMMFVVVLMLIKLAYDTLIGA